MGCGICHVMIKKENCPDISDALPLERIFGTPSSKILDFLLLNQKFDYSESDICKLAEVSTRTVQRTVPCLVGEKLITRTRKSGKAYMYEANLESVRVKALHQYVKATIEENLQMLEIRNINKSKTKNNKLFEQ